MVETILSKLEASRKELLDLGLRNPLLNYKSSKSRGVSIVQEKSASIFDLLVNQEKAMSFLGRPVKKDSAEIEVVELSQPELEESYVDTKLQTNESDPNLQKRLLNTFYSAATSMEEQGINILYISLGMLKWYEDENSEEARLAPLILIPVNIERSNARERFKIKYTAEDIGANISLQAKMKNEFDVTIPDIGEIDDFDINKYFKNVSAAVEFYKKWEIEIDAIELGFFSFGKFVIYNDLDNSNWPKGNSPTDHPILQDLFEKGFRDSQPSAHENSFIDRDTNAHELFQVVDADSSQTLAMLAVHEGRNLVIQGPPGTGKSQTITNIIANAIGNGKKVLFVAEKMAALDVVKRRLDSVNLGDACLELHSHKANKRELHAELKRVFELSKPSIQQLEKEVTLLETHQKELNTYCVEINTPIGNSGITTHQLIGFLLKLNEHSKISSFPKIQIKNIEELDEDKMQKIENFAKVVEAKVKDIGTPSKLLFWGSKLKVLLLHQQEGLLSLMKDAKLSIEQIKTESFEISKQLNFPEPIDRKTSLQLSKVVEFVSTTPNLKGLNLQSNRWITSKPEIEELLKSGKSLSEIIKKHENVVKYGVWENNISEIKRNIEEHHNKWYKFLISDYKKSNKKFSSLLKYPISSKTDIKLKYINDILECKKLAAVIQKHEALANEIFGGRWQRLRSNWSELLQGFEYLSRVHQEISNESLPKEVLDYLLKNQDNSSANGLSKTLQEKLITHETSVDQLVKVIEFDESIRFNNGGLKNQPFTEQIDLLANWIEGITEIHHTNSWNNLLETAVDDDLTYLTDIASRWEDAGKFLKDAVRKTWYEYLMELSVNTYPSIRKFERTTHEETALQFKKLDVLNQEYKRIKAAQRHWENIPKLDAGGQVTLLRKEFNKKSRHLAIRKLMQDAGTAIQGVKPVFMMSPLSIANFLPPGLLEFDLVVFDEASQVRPVDAIGALLRGKQLVVVGDTKQLPPTSFFDSLSKESVDDEDNVTSDIQSILGMCDAQGAPQRMLRWHYRSRHESLITISNHEFYENKLVIFPSPGSKHRMGLSYHYLPETFYDRGKTRTNPKEAEIVADAVIQHARNNPKLSLGVVAFSTSQRQAIQDALEIRRRKFPELEAFFSNHSHEPFFVKNLENVQGDERDVIFISIGYGKTAEGYLSMSFGPLNNDGGERRLNVLITRAKLRCEVFTNITSSDLDLNRTKSYGIKAFKSFLHYAQHGKLDMVEETGLEEDSPFEANVAEKLTNSGYIVRKQIGSQGFRIDLGIVDEANPGRYIMGIECDGASYHSSRSAKDRDRLRQQVLESIGWKIHRIWSTDWFKNSERELQRAIAAIEKAKQELLIDDEAFEQDAKAMIEESIKQEALISSTQQSLFYELAKLPSDIGLQEIHTHPIGKLCEWIEHIVKVESPVHFDEVARRMVEAAGISRVGQRIKETIEKAVKHSHQTKNIVIKGEFLWHGDMQKPIIRDRTSLSGTSKKIKLIAPEEIFIAIEKIVKESVAIHPDGAIPLVAKMLGFSRVTEDIKKDIHSVIKVAIEEKIIVYEGELLK